MATPQRITDYTNRDYASLLASLLDLADLKLPEWTDRSENDLGRLLVELFAYVGDELLYYQDRIANEAFLATAVERRSIIDLMALIGYTLATPSPASAKLTIQAPNEAATPLRVEVGARFATQALPGKPAIEFSYLPVTGLPLEVARDGTGVDLAFELTVLHATQVLNEILGTSTGEPNQSFRLAQRPVLLPRDPDSQDNLRLEVDAGGGFQGWAKRGTLLYSHSDDPHFGVQIDDSDEAEIIFGDGTYGRIPPAGSTIRATYLIGGGQEGNVGPHTITVAKSGVNVPVTVTNPQAAAGGADRESIEHARVQAPQVFRSLHRAVTAADYAALAQNVPGVARAVAVAPSWNYVDIYAVASGGLELTDDLRARLLRYFEDRRMVTTLISIRQPVFVSIDLSVEVGVEPTFYRVDVSQRVEEALADLFRIEAQDFGQTFYLSKVFEAVEAVDGVAFARVTTFLGVRSDPPGELVDPAAAATGLIQLRPKEFPRQGLITVTIAVGGLG
jgi:Baseplate J-like protein